MVKLTRFNIAIAFFAALGGYTYAYGYAVIAVIYGQPAFYAYFNINPNTAHGTSIVGAISALFATGAALGSVAQGWTGDRLGRKKSMAVSSVIALVGGAGVTGSVNVPMLIVFRFIQGFGLGQSFALVPLYITEISPPHTRGAMAGLAGGSIVTGYLSSAWVGYGAYFAKNAAVQWRLPLALTTLGPLCILSGLYWLPESPRYLALVNRYDECWRVLKLIHHDPSDLEDSSAYAEHVQITKQVELDMATNTGYLAMFTKRSWRYRVLLAILLMFATQSSGALCITTFQVLIYNSLGLYNSLPLLMYGVYVTVSVIFNYAGVLTNDRIGRRRVLLIGYPGLAICLLGEALLQKYYIGTDNKGGNAAAVLFLYLFICFYGFCVDPAQFVYVTEIFPTNIRAKGVAIAFCTYFVGCITYTSSATLALQNIGWRMYMIWFACCIVTTILIYFYVPDTTGLALEELGELFGDEVAVHLQAKTANQDDAQMPPQGHETTADESEEPKVAPKPSEKGNSTHIEAAASPV